MKASITIVFLFLYCSVCGYGQEKIHIQTMPVITLNEGDSARLRYYLSNAMEMEKSNSDTAMAMYFKIFSAAEKTGYHKGMDSTLMYMHRSVYRTGTNRHKGTYLRAAAGYSDDPAISRDIMIHILHDAAITALYQDEYTRAGYYFRKALSLFNPNDTDSISVSLKQLTYASISSLWLIMHEEEHALEWMRKAERLAASAADKAALAVNKSAVYTNLKQPDSAYRYASEAVSLSDQHDQAGTISAAYLNLAQVLIEKGKPREALKYLETGLARREADRKRRLEQGERSPVFLPNDLKYHYLRGKAYIQLGDFEKAEQFLTIAYNNQKRHGFRGDLLETLELLSHTSAGQGNYKEAWYYHQEYKRMSDSISKIEKSRAVDAEIRYQTAEKDRLLALKQLSLVQSQSKIRNKNTLLVSVSVGAVLLAGFLFSTYRSGRHRQKLHVERLRLMQQDQEISNLKAMMQGEEKERARLARELHDGIMVQLSTVKMRLRTLARQQSADTDQQELEETLRQLDNTTKELRQSAHSLMPDMLLEGGLAEAVFYFCKNLPTGPGLRINFQQYGNIPRMQPEFEIALYRIVQELVQNIIKHANATKGLIQFNCREGMLYITVEDNGKGFDVKENGKEGMGLKSIRTRLRALNGIMDISSHRQSGTAVNLEFDIRTVIIPEKENYVY